MAHQYSRVGFKSSVEVNEVNLSLSYGGVYQNNDLTHHNPIWPQIDLWPHKVDRGFQAYVHVQVLRSSYLLCLS